MQKDLVAKRGMPSSSNVIRLFGSNNAALLQAGLPLNHERKLTNQQLVSRLRLATERLGRPLSRDDLKSEKFGLSLSTLQHRFGSLNEAYRAAGIRAFHRQARYTRSQLLRFILQFNREQGRPPRHADFRNESGYPDATTYKRFFGSFNNAIRLTGLKPVPGWRNKFWSSWQGLCAEMARVMYGSEVNDRETPIPGVGRPDIVVPSKRLIIDATTTPKFVLKKKDQAKRYIRYGRVEFWCIFHDKILVRHPKIKYVFIEQLRDKMRELGRNDLAKQCEYRMVVRRKAEERQYSDAELGRYLKEFYAKHGRVPQQREFNSKENLPSSSVYANRFGTWNDALLHFELPIAHKFRFTDQEIIDDLRRFRREHGRAPTQDDLDFKYRGKYVSVPCIRKHFGTFNNALKAAGLPVKREWRVDREYLIRALQELAQRLGRTPKALECKHAPAVIKHFGSWNNGLRAADLQPLRSDRRKKTKRQTQRHKN